MRSPGRTRPACWLALAAAAAGAGGCSANYGTDASGMRSPVSLRIEPRRTRVAPGETVTILTRAVIDPASDAQVRWKASGGATVATEQDGRVARVTFDRVGTHRVEAALVSPTGRELRRARTTIEVAASP